MTCEEVRKIFRGKEHILRRLFDGGLGRKGSVLCCSVFGKIRGEFGHGRSGAIKAGFFRYLQVRSRSVPRSQIDRIFGGVRKNRNLVRRERNGRVDGVLLGLLEFEAVGFRAGCK